MQTDNFSCLGIDPPDPRSVYRGNALLICNDFDKLMHIQTDNFSCLSIDALDLRSVYRGNASLIVMTWKTLSGDDMY